MDEHNGRDSMKAILGIILVFAGTFMAFKSYPVVSKVPAPSRSVSGESPMATQQLVQAQEMKQLHEQLGALEEQKTVYFKWLILAFCLVDLGALLLYLSGESSKKTA